jgi:DNA topoisomerase I
MAKNLLIVESPAKAKTIEKFLGKDFKVTSSQGHIRDLIKGNKAIKIKEGYEPVYQISPDKEKMPMKCGWLRTRTARAKPSVGICARH